MTGGFDTELRRLKAAGYPGLPQSPVQARITAKQVEGMVNTPGALSENTRTVRAQMRRSRLANAARTGGLRRTGSDLTMALPKIRTPGMSLQDKGIPLDIADPKQLSEARAWSRLFYCIHDLVPLLIDIYARFPLTGLEFVSKDPQIENFYSDMFLNQLNYEEWLPECLGREYYISGEVTSLAHFNEELGIWSSEEILNPDMVRVSKSLFVTEERVQLLVKDMVESLRAGPQGMALGEESHSERQERTWEYQQLVKHYPEVISAATQDDGLDISEALWSRIVNKTSPWDLRGTPFLMRSFGTLLMEESLNAAQDSVADRLYSPLILATLGIQDMGDGEPWIPDQSELDDLRDDFQSALAADFKLMCHHFGLQIQPVFGREAVPRFDQDYERIDMKLMQAWGIGSALVMGGTAAAGTYASSALNREVCELLMKGFQRKVVQHIRKRMEVIAEAQEHFDYELKGGVRRPLYREVIEEDPETGEKRVVRAPKLLIPEIRFSSLNLRDEQTERAFITQLKQMGIPISDKTMAVNLPVQFDQELVRQGNEKVDKLVAEAEAMSKAQKIIDQKELPYPAELAQWLTQTLVLRQQLAQTDLMETQQKQMEQQAAQMSPAGQLGLLPGTVPMPPPPPPGMEDDQAGGPPPGGPGMPPLGAAPPPVEVARNRARPEESDDLRAGAPRAAATNGHTRKLSQFERGPSSYGSARRASEQRVTDAVRRREVIARHPVPRMEDLVHDPGFYALLNSPHESQLQADWPAIMAGQARESADIARELAEQYEYVTGVTPEWD